MSRTPDVCQSYDEDLSGLLDGELAPERDAELRAHLVACTRCRERLAAFGALSTQLRDLPPRPVPSDLEARLRARLAVDAPGPARAAPLAGSGSRRRLMPVFAATLLAAAAALALYLGVVRSPGSPEPSLPVVRRDAPQPPVADLDTASDEDLAVAIELETLEDLDVIANLELLEQLDARTGKDQG